MTDASRNAVATVAIERTPAPSTGDSVAVSLRGVARSFGDVRAVSGVDLELHHGEVVAFLGPNGAGKTTTIDMILGLTDPTSGQVDVMGMAPREAVARGLVAAVMQTGGLLKDLTVRETVSYVGSLFASARPVDDVMEEAGISRIGERMVSRCSGGEQQRLRFALALLPDPALIVLDEPTTGMDVEGRRSFWGSIRVDARRGRTVLFATHYLEEADQYADRIVLMRHGRIVADGTGDEIRALAAGRVVTATIPDADARSLGELSWVRSVEVRGDRVRMHTDDSDALARHLLAHTAAHGLEITSAGLEEAFLRLTGDDDAGPGADRSTRKEI